MAVWDETSRKAEWEMRSSQRVNSRIRVAVEWKANGETLRKEGYTLNVGRTGCLAVLPHDMTITQRVQLTNLVTKQSIEATVVWRGEERPEGRELGLQLADSKTDFWGLEL